MVVNNLVYLNEVEYNDLACGLIKRRGCSNKIKNITISKCYTNVEFINYIYEKLNLERRFSDEEENRYDGLYDYFRDIDGRWSDPKIRVINVLIEDEEYLNSKMLYILGRLQNHLANEVLIAGSENSFPLSFDIYIKKDNGNRTLKKSISRENTSEFITWDVENRPVGAFGGSIYKNENKKLPVGNYREYDVNEKKEQDRDGQRFIRNVDTGDVYFTPDHYVTFLKIQE